MSFRGYRRLAIAMLLPLLFVLARGSSAQDATIGLTQTQEATPPGDRCGLVLAYHDASLGRLATARELVERTSGPVPTMPWGEGGSAALDLMRAQRDEVVPPGGELAQQLVLATLASWQMFMIDMDLGQLQPTGTGLADANEAMTRAFSREEQATLELARIARNCSVAPPVTTPVPGQGNQPARDVTPEGGAQIWSCPPDVPSDYCVAGTEPAR